MKAHHITTTLTRSKETKQINFTDLMKVVKDP